MKQIIALFDKALDWMAFLAGCLLIFIMLSVCADVVLRTFFKISLTWVIEVSEVMLLYITFLGSAWLLRGEGHVQVDIFLTRLGSKTMNFLAIISSLIGVFVSIVLTIFGTSVTLENYYRGVYTPTLLEIPLYLILLIIPFGSLFLIVQFIRRTGIHVAKLKNEIRKARRIKGSKGDALCNGG